MEIVDNETKDEVMNEIVSKPSNQSCFDCGNRLPRWSSPYLGILLCMECAGRHRGYGTHISFIKSIDLDKWNKKQLKSLELTGNLYVKKLFEQYGVPKIDSNYDYNSKKILDIRKEIEDLVKDNLKPTDYTHKKNKATLIKEENKANLDKKENEENILKPIKFEMKNVIINKKAKDDKKVHKKNKIKKIDIDFNFDNFKEVSNDNIKNDENNEEDAIDTKKISGMKISRKDKKKMMIEEKKKVKNPENIQKKTCCEKLRAFIYKFILFFNSKES